MVTDLRKRIYDLWQEYRFLLLAFFIPAIIMWLIYIAMEVYPFGSSSVLVLDLNGQYVYFFEDLRNKVLNGGSFLYTWTRSMGGEFMGIYAYYLASPFSFLICLFSENHITEGLLLIILLKVGCMGATMSYYLHHARPGKKLNTIIFSTCYALSAYAVVMAHNTMWIDNLILLPLVTLGIENLINKKQFKLFVVTLSMALLTSFYIGYMTCIYVLLYFFYYYVAHDNHNENNFWLETNHFWKSLARIAVYSLIAVSIAMIIVYPAYTSLQFGKSTFSTAKYTFTQRFDFLDFMTKFFPGSYDTVRPEGIPFVYCGIISLLLLPMYFISSRIRWQERIMTGVFLVFLIVCFNINAIDIVWHGFQKPNWLNYRYSFMFIFLMLVAAYKAYDNLQFANYKHVVFIAGVFTVMLFLIQKQDYEWITDFKCIWLSILCIAVFAVTLWFVYSGKFRIYGTAVILVLVCIELFTSGLLNTIALDEDVVISSRTSYNSYMEKVRPSVEFVKEYDTSPFYRMEKNFHRKINDPMTLHFYGISNSTSTLNKSVIELLHSYGYASKSHWTKYLGGTPMSDALLGIRYVISNKEIDNQVWEEIHVDDTYGYYTYYNPYALSLAYAVSEDLKDYQITDYESPFLVLNSTAAAITGEESVEIFKKLELLDTEFKNTKTGFTTQHRKYSKENESLSASIEYTVSVKGGVPTYMSIPTDYPREAGLKVNGSVFDPKTCMANETDRVIYLGIFDEDQEITVTLELKDDPLYIMTGQEYFFYMDIPLFEEVFTDLAKGNMEITRFGDTFIEGSINVPEDKTLLYTSVTFDEGWHIRIDGKEAELIKVNDSQIAVAITPGSHTVTMKYSPKCYTLGSAISVAGLVAFAGAIVLDEWYKRREMKRWAVENNIFL